MKDLTTGTLSAIVGATLVYYGYRELSGLLSFAVCVIGLSALVIFVERMNRQ